MSIQTPSQLALLSSIAFLAILSLHAIIIGAVKLSLHHRATRRTHRHPTNRFPAVRH